MAKKSDILLLLILTSCHRQVPHFGDPCETEGGTSNSSYECATNTSTTSTITGTDNVPTTGEVLTEIITSTYNTTELIISSSETTETGSTTYNPICGDVVVNNNEVCDDGINDGSYNSCSPDCSEFGPYCGDNEVNGSEECDQGGVQNEFCEENCKIPTCGDGFVNSKLEQCDDGNLILGDGCGNCTTERRVFISSKDYPGNLGGIPGADEKCQKLADDVGLSGEYKAWKIFKQRKLDRLWCYEL